MRRNTTGGATAFVLFVSLRLGVCFAMDTQLSDPAIREAYFLAQRHDNTLADFYAKYDRVLPAPKSGPHISQIQFVTPFEETVEFFDRQHGNYSAQQALVDRSGKPEIVKVFVHIALTESYGRLLPASSGDRSGQAARTERPADFWKEFRVNVYDDSRVLTPRWLYGKATWSCLGARPCILTGAVIEYRFPAKAFTSDRAVIDVTPPEGDAVTATFDLEVLR